MNLELHLQRLFATEHSTIGALTIAAKHQCYSLEDRLRLDGIKVPGQTCIPAGRYQIIIDYSPHFKKHLPHLLDVPNFEGVRIHSGNTDADTEGCIIVGRRRATDAVYESHLAFDPLFKQLVDAQTIENCQMWISIENPPTNSKKKEGTV